MSNNTSVNQLLSQATSSTDIVSISSFIEGRIDPESFLSALCNYAQAFHITIVQTTIKQGFWSSRLNYKIKGTVHNMQQFRKAWLRSLETRIR
jgi:hypothetical protein